MNILDIAIIIILIFVFYKFLIKKNNKEKFIPEKNNYDKYIETILNSKKKPKINEYFSEIQYHQNYKDTIDAFNLLMPNERQLFNKGDLPITNIVKPSNTELKKLISNFIKEINKIIKYHITDELPNKIKSGWDKQQEELGLPSTIYDEPVLKASVKLIKIDHSEKCETTDEIRYIVYLILQKKNVKDQIVIKVIFVVDKRDWNLDREFFEKNKNSYDTSVKIEDISIIGFMLVSNNSKKKKSSRETFYEFNSIKDGIMFSQKDIIKELNNKKKQYIKECNNN